VPYGKHKVKTGGGKGAKGCAKTEGLKTKGLKTKGLKTEGLQTDGTNLSCLTSKPRKILQLEALMDTWRPPEFRRG
jgi:hypothetical protein